MDAETLDECPDDKIPSYLEYLDRASFRMMRYEVDDLTQPAVKAGSERHDGCCLTQKQVLERSRLRVADEIPGASARWKNFEDILLLTPAVFSDVDLGATIAHELTHGVLDMLDDQPAVRDLERAMAIVGIVWPRENERVAWFVDTKIQAQVDLHFRLKGLNNRTFESREDLSSAVAIHLNTFQIDVADAEKRVGDPFIVMLADQTLLGSSVPRMPLLSAETSSLIDRIHVKAGFAQ